MTPADRLRAMAEEEEKRAAELEDSIPAIRAAIEAHRAGAAGMRKLADEMDTEHTALTSSHRPSTVEDVSTELSSNALRSQAQIADDVKKHRLVVAMAKRGLSFADVAAALEEKLKRSFPRSTVQSWVKPKTNPSWRGIPQDAADALKALYGVPLSAWARIIPG